uniref:Uncharacterized protein n=1 Tax=Craspedostauros australis TaxID=1486917 RepID=A0A7R9WYA8_9STRA
MSALYQIGQGRGFQDRVRCQAKTRSCRRGVQLTRQHGEGCMRVMVHTSTSRPTPYANFVVLMPLFFLICFMDENDGDDFLRLGWTLPQRENAYVLTFRNWVVADDVVELVSQLHTSSFPSSCWLPNPILGRLPCV